MSVQCNTCKRYYKGCTDSNSWHSKFCSDLCYTKYLVAEFAKRDLQEKLKSEQNDNRETKN